MGLFRRNRKDEAPVADAPAPAAAPAEPAGRSFGFKCAWLAVRAGDPADVAQALGLQDTATTPWARGIAAVSEDAGERPAPVFAGGPIDGWVLVPFGWALAEPGELDLDLAGLSRRFGEVQRFATQRVVDAHEWERWADGQPLRRYGWLGESGEVRFNEGEPTEHDEDVLPDGDAEWDDWEIADEERVMEIAAAWSVDPTTLDEGDGVPGEGLLGRL